jgi:hypothetical protein
MCYNINWTIAVGTGIAPFKVFVNYSIDGGSSYFAIPGTQPFSQATDGAGTHAWSISTSIPPSTNCKVQVGVVGGGHGTGASGVFKIQASSSAPPAPLNLVAKSGDGFVQLNWDAVTVATSYKVYRHNSTETVFTLITTTTTNTYNDTTVTNGETYTYLVTALKGSLESPPSNDAVATPLPSVPEPSPAPLVLILVILVVAIAMRKR